MTKREGTIETLKKHYDLEFTPEKVAYLTRGKA